MRHFSGKFKNESNQGRCGGRVLHKLKGVTDRVKRKIIGTEFIRVLKGSG